MAYKFMKLPPELRNRIYEYTLVEEEPVRPLAISLTRDKAFIFREPGILKLSTDAGLQIREEALPIYCNRNTFWFAFDLRKLDKWYGSAYSTIEFEEWLKHIGPENFKVLTNVRCTLKTTKVLEPARTNVIADWKQHGLVIDETVVSFVARA